MFERLIRNVIQRLPSRRLAALTVHSAGNNGIVTSAGGAEELRAWTDVKSVHAVVCDGFVGNHLALLVEFSSDGLIASVSELAPNWQTIADAFFVNLAGFPEYLRWTLELVAAPDKALKIFGVTASGLRPC